MESETVDQEQEQELRKSEPRITEARVLPPPKNSSRKFAIFGALLVVAGI
jgi:hypothetical protein